MSRKTKSRPRAENFNYRDWKSLGNRRTQKENVAADKKCELMGTRRLGRQFRRDIEAYNYPEQPVDSRVGVSEQVDWTFNVQESPNEVND